MPTYEIDVIVRYCGTVHVDAPNLARAKDLARASNWDRLLHDGRSDTVVSRARLAPPARTGEQQR